MILSGPELNTFGLLVNSITEHTKKIETLSKSYLDALYRDGDVIAAQSILDEIHFTKGVIRAYRNCQNLIIEQALSVITGTNKIEEN